MSEERAKQLYELAEKPENAFRSVQVLCAALYHQNTVIIQLLKDIAINTGGSTGGLMR